MAATGDPAPRRWLDPRARSPQIYLAFHHSPIRPSLHAGTRRVQRGHATTAQPQTAPHHSAQRLTVAAELEGVAALPGGRRGATDDAIAAVAALAQATARAAGRSEAAQLAVLVDGVGDPVDRRVAADGLVLGIHQDDLEVLVGGVLVDPVRVQHAQVAAAAAHALLSDGTQVAAELQLVDAVVLRLSVHDTLAVLALAAATAHSNAVHDVALLGLVAEATGLVLAGGAVHTHDLGQLAVLPGAHTQQEAHDIALLLPPKLLLVLVGAHADGRAR
mmetsp:Transcript_12927/g.19320  ORF Transcript_12927/g.19320 Transcript_12927/m.19320 type:complete len:275 (+) Transcript_12927:231-1055(+)